MIRQPFFDDRTWQKFCSSREKRQLKEALNIPSENKVVIYTGRIVPEKGIKELLKAFENVENDNVTLLIIGSTGSSHGQRPDGFPGGTERS